MKRHIVLAILAFLVLGTSHAQQRYPRDIDTVTQVLTNAIDQYSQFSVKGVSSIGDGLGGLFFRAQDTGSLTVDGTTNIFRFTSNTNYLLRRTITSLAGISGIVTGTGTTGVVPKWSDTSGGLTDGVTQEGSNFVTPRTNNVTAWGSTTNRWSVVNSVLGNFSGTVSGSQYTSTVGSGTPPMVVSSVTQVDNFNAHYLNGHDGGWYNPMASVGEVVYGGASGVPTRLLGQGTTNVAFLTQVGTGSAYPNQSAAPFWSSLAAGTGITLTQTGTNLTIGTTTGSGLRSVTLSVPGMFEVSTNIGGTGGSATMTNDGTFYLTMPAVTANTVLAGPITGGPGSAAFRALGTNDLPSIGVNQMSATGTKDGTTYLAGDNTWKTAATGTALSGTTNYLARFDSTGTNLTTGYLFETSNNFILPGTNAVTSFGSTTNRINAVNAVTGNFSSTVTGSQLISSVAVGTAPLTVVSSNRVDNLNVQYLSGFGFDYFNPMTTAGDIIYGGTSGLPTRLADVATGNALISGGVGVAPSWGKIGLTTHVSGTLPVANGGTGGTGTATNGTVLVGNGTIWTPAATTDVFVDTTNHRLGIGTASPGAFLDIVGTTEQARWRYDAAHYVSFTVASDSSLKIEPSTATSWVQIGNNNVGAKLAFAGQTASFPMIYRSGTEIHFKLADNSDYTTVRSGRFIITDTSGNSKYDIRTVQNTMASDIKLLWRDNVDVFTGATDLGVVRAGVGVLRITDGNTGSGRLLVGSGTINGGQLEVLSTTEQRRSSYDATHYLSETVNSSGNVTWVPSGGTANLTGILEVSGAGSFGSSVTVPAASYFYWLARSAMSSPVDGQVLLQNNALTDFSRLQLGGTTASFPAIKRSSAGLDFRVADDSAYAATASLYDRFGAGSPESVVTAPIGTIYHRTDGGAGTALYVKESGTGNTGWVAYSSTGGGGGGVTLSGTAGVIPQFDTTGTNLTNGYFSESAGSSTDAWHIPRTNNVAYVGSSTNRLKGVYSVAGNFSGQITSTVSSGTPPLVVASTTEVSNLNAAQLNGHDGSYYNPMFSLGEIIYGGASGIPTRLLGSTSTTPMFLTQTGNGGSYPSGSAAPTWAALTVDNMPAGVPFVKAVSLTCTNGTQATAFTTSAKYVLTGILLRATTLSGGANTQVKVFFGAGTDPDVNQIGTTGATQTFNAVDDYETTQTWLNAAGGTLPQSVPASTAVKVHCAATGGGMVIKVELMGYYVP